MKKEKNVTLLFLPTKFSKVFRCIYYYFRNISVILWSTLQNKSMSFLNKIFAPLLLSFLVSCNNQESQESGDAQESPKTFAEKLEMAHSKEAFLKHDIIEFDLLLKFRGKERLNGRLTLTTDSQSGIIREKNGDEIYFNGDKVFYKDRDSLNTEKIRFKAFTWSYFFLFPYKLTDPGVNWSEYENKSLDDKNFKVEKMTFDPGTGDSPDDWYITYADPATDLVHAAAYIVTYTKSQDEAEEDPHAIVYEDYKQVDGIPLSHYWTFWGWNDGVLNKQLGEATLSNFKFLKANERSFEAPLSFKEI